MSKTKLDDMHRRYAIASTQDRGMFNETAGQYEARDLFFSSETKDDIDALILHLCLNWKRSRNPDYKKARQLAYDRFTSDYAAHLHRLEMRSKHDPVS